MAIGRTNAGGGGTSLNFKVVGGTTRPTSPKENTIWVNTDVDIPGWAFSATEPESPEAGMVWFPTGDTSNVAFNALRKNDIHVYPSGAKQYIGSEWVSKKAETYQGSQWVRWARYLYNNGDQCLPVSGGFDAKNVDISTTGYNGKAPTIIYGTSTMTIELMQTDSDTGAVGGAVYAKNKFDLSNYSSIEWRGWAQGQYDIYTQLCVFSDLAKSSIVASINIYEKGYAFLDVSWITGEMYVGFSLRSSGKSDSAKAVILVSELLVS